MLSEYITDIIDMYAYISKYLPAHLAHLAVSQQILCISLLIMHNIRVALPGYNCQIL